MANRLDFVPPPYGPMIDLGNAGVGHWPSWALSDASHES